MVGDETAEVDAAVLGVHQQHPAQQQEQGVDNHQNARETEHVALGILEVAAGEVLLHHVLVQSRHHDGDEHAAHNLLQEVVGFLPIGLENLGVAGIFHLLEDVGERHVQLLDDENDGEDERGEHEGGLEGVGPHNGLDAAPEGVEQDDDNHHGGGGPDGDAEAIENEGLQDVDDEVHPQGGAEQAGDDEEQGAGAVRFRAHPPVKHLIHRGDILAVIERQQHVGDGEVAEDVADDDAEVGELDVGHIARHRHEGDARQRGTDHAVGHDKPRRLAVAREVSGVVGLPCREPHNHKKQQRVGTEAYQYELSHSVMIKTCKDTRFLTIHRENFKDFIHKRVSFIFVSLIISSLNSVQEYRQVFL